MLQTLINEEPQVGGELRRLTLLLLTLLLAGCSVTPALLATKMFVSTKRQRAMYVGTPPMQARRELDSITGGWQWLCQGTSGGNALVRYSPGEKHIPG